MVVTVYAKSSLGLFMCPMDGSSNRIFLTRLFYHICSTYIRLTKLIKPLLDLVDEGKIALTPAEKLSYFKEAEQLALVELIQDYDSTPSLSQAVKLKEMSAKQTLDADMMFDIMSRPKANQKETLKLDLNTLRDFFPDHTPKDMESAIIRILTEWQKKEQSKVQNRSSWDRDGR